VQQNYSTNSSTTTSNLAVSISTQHSQSINLRNDLQAIQVMIKFLVEVMEQTFVDVIEFVGDLQRGAGLNLEHRDP